MIAAQGVIHREAPNLAWYRWTSVQAVEVTTSRRSVVLAHGITDSAACWTRIAKHLTDELPVDVIAVDARGHGRSQRAADYSVAAGVGDLVDAIDALRLQRPVLAGHSMAGPHVTAAASEVQAAAVAVIDPHWPLAPQDDTTYDVGAWRRDVARDAATDLRDLVREGRVAHSSGLGDHGRRRRPDRAARAPARRAAPPRGGSRAQRAPGRLPLRGGRTRQLPASRPGVRGASAGSVRLRSLAVVATSSTTP